MNEQEEEKTSDADVGGGLSEHGHSNALVVANLPRTPLIPSTGLPTTWINEVDSNQAKARAGRDLVGGNQVKIGNYISMTAAQKRPIAALLERLQKEIELDEKVAEHIEALRYFETRRSLDGIDGLEAKLIKSGQNVKIMWALEQKEQFVKALEKWSLYSSAQEIFAHFLGRAYYEFGERILPNLGSLSPAEIADIFDARFVQPAVDECGAGLLVVNHAIAIGMVYWLAEQCFVRWHK